MLHAKWLVIAIATSLMLNSCDGKVEVLFSCKPPTQSQSAAQSDSLDIIVDVDGSASMLGYVSNPDSRYVQTLKLLDETLSIDGGGLRSKTSTNYYRSGNSVIRGEFRKAQLPVFYNDTDPKFPNIAVPIQEFITSPGQKDTLLVIVTDLDQAEGDITILNQKIQQTYLNKNKPGYAVGIWAIKSEFRGTVYVQEQQKIPQFPFPNEQSAEKVRPFYVIFIGRYSDIVSYFNTLKTQGGSLIEGSQLAIFSPHNIVQEPSYLDKNLEGNPPEEQALAQDWNLANNLVKVQAKDQNSQLWQIHSNQKGEVRIQDSVNLMPLNDTLNLDINSIDTIKNIQVFDKFSQQFKKSKELLPDDSSLQNVINIGQWSSPESKENEGQKLSFVTTIQPDKFPESGIYIFTIDVEVKNLQEQNWWKDWSWTAERDQKNDGSKTHNLLNFLRGLKTMTTNVMAENPPNIGRFCYVLQKD